MPDALPPAAVPQWDLGHPQGPFAVRAQAVHTVHDRAGRNAPVLRGVDLGIPAGALTVIMGSSRLPLLRLLAGVDEPQRGRLHFAHPTNARCRPVAYGGPTTGNPHQPSTALWSTHRHGSESVTHPAIGAVDNVLREPTPASNRHRLMLNSILRDRPEVLFADNQRRTDRHNLIPAAVARRYVDELGGTVVLATDDARVAVQADHVVFTHRGKVVEVLHEPSLDVVTAVNTLIVKSPTFAA